LEIKTERVDDIPLLMAQMQRMELVSLLDQHFPTIPTQDILDTYLLSTLADAYSCLVKLTTHL